MTIQTYIALFGWPIVSLVICGTFGVRRGLCACFVFGYLLLPTMGLQLADGLPSYNKEFAISVGALLAALAFDPGPLSRLRLQWFDLFVLVAWAGWGISSLTNGLGIQEALLMWWYYGMIAGIPYFLGRCYLVGPTALLDLAITIVAGTMVYAVGAIIEMRMSPQITQWVYGFNYGQLYELRRDLTIGSFSIGGFRPRVLLYAGLALAIWMAAGTVVAWSLWYGGVPSKILKLRLSVVSVTLAVVTVLCRGTGAFALMFGAIAALIATKMLRLRLAVMWIPCFVVLYIATALVGSFLPIRDILVSGSEAAFGSVRSGSLDFRFRHEDALVDKALQAPIFGWGGWLRNRVDEEIAREQLGKRSVTDGFWIIVLGQRGLVGLLGTYGWMLVPAILAVLWAIRVKAPPPVFYSVVGLSAWSTLFALDQLLNGFNHPVQALVAGALGAFVVVAQRHARTPPRRAATSPPSASLPPAGRSPAHGQLISSAPSRVRDH